MTAITALHETIRPITEAALEAGFHVYGLRKERGPVTFVYVCLDTAGSYATIGRPTHDWDGAQLSAPIKPSREYGSAVREDYDGTVDGAIETLRKVCSSPNVTVRFVGKRGQAAPVVPNYGRNVLDKWPGGPERFEELQPERA